MAHELCHALGTWHEQSRSDRDDFVTIEWDNIDEEHDHNVEIVESADTFGTYDFDSVMHYGECSFSTCGSCSIDPSNCRTITVQEPNSGEWQDAIGQRDHLSAKDTAGMANLYGTTGPVYVDSTYTGGSSAWYALGSELWSIVVYELFSGGGPLHSVDELHSTDHLPKQLVAAELSPPFLCTSA